MWNKLKKLTVQPFWQDKSYRRLTLALGFSLLLHLFLIGKFHFNLPDLHENRQLIEARLQLPKLANTPAKAPETAPQIPSEKPPAPKKVKVKKLSPPKEAPPKELPVAETPPPTSTEPISQPPLDDQASNAQAPIDTAEVVPAGESAALKGQPESTEPMADNPTDESSLIINPHPYHKVEAAFDVYTDPDAALDSLPAGSATVTYQQLANGAQYQIKSLIQAKGLVSLVVPDLLQTSEGDISNQGLRPKHYLYQFGDNKNKTFQAAFDWDNKKLTLSSAKGQENLDLPEGTQDLLSFMYQFMFVPPLQTMQLNITNAKKLGVYDYAFEGEEVITTKMGDLNTVHLMRASAEGEKKTELWLAVDYQYVPVKIRETDSKGKVYALLAKSLNTEPPATKQSAPN